ncbi:uncharacterized protein [Pleurodeles waltl]|uniref:uncharacterized protein isoform X2 n=1 Tax=Pleurodeles waltl TaxID=8319 RepID=UPI003709AC2A
MKAVAFRGTLLLSALLVGIAYALECYSSKDRPVDSKDLLASIQCAENETYCVANITGVEGVRQCKDGGRQKNKQRPRRKPHQLYTTGQQGFIRSCSLSNLPYPVEED